MSIPRLFRTTDPVIREECRTNKRRIVNCTMCPNLKILVCKDGVCSDFCPVQEGQINEPRFSWCCLGLITIKHERQPTMMNQLVRETVESYVFYERISTADGYIRDKYPDFNTNINRFEFVEGAINAQS